MKIIHLSTVIIASLLFTSCTLGGSSSSSGTGATYTPTKPTISLKQSSPTTVTNWAVATPTYGSGKMQVEIFADFQCPACIAYNDSVMPIFEEYASQGKVMMTYRQFPLQMHKNAKWDAIAALCSAELGGYMDYKKWLYTMEKEKSGKTTTDADRIAIAKSIGLDEVRFTSCLANKTYEKQVDADIALGDAKWVSATPTVYLDGIKIDMSLFRDIAGFRSFLESRMK
jgi:protein-disulfide isomerase